TTKGTKVHEELLSNVLSLQWIVNVVAVRIPPRRAPSRSVRVGDGRLCSSSLLRNIVTYVRSAYPKNDIFSDVSGVVGDALQITGNEQRIQRLARDLRAIVHGFDQTNKGVIAHAVYDVIHLENSLR